MSDRHGRHRAPQRPTTPLDSITDTLTGQLSAVTGQLGTVGRSGAVLAVSTGLVATMGLPASAVTKTAPGTGVSLSRSSVVAASAVALPASVTGGAAVSAPASATVTFEQGSITASKAAPKPKARQQVKVSRSRTAHAVKRTSTPKKQTAPVRSVDTSSIVSIAKSLLGIPYRFGGTTTAGFDCSGFTRYVYAQAGLSLPRTSGQQYGAVRHIPRSQAKPGDLVFILSGGRVGHVGIYLGGNMMIDSPRSGKATQIRAIWSSNAVFGTL